jgi:hypothetical protein
MKPVTNIDVFDYPFPTKKGFQVIRQGYFELLILKLEIDDSIKERAIKEFLGLKDFRLIRANIGQEKNYAESYRDFLRTIHLPEEYVQMLNASDYAKHFYSKKEIDAVQAKWRDRITRAELPPAVHEKLLKASSRIVH